MSDPTETTGAATAAAGSYPPQALRFTGTGREYFGIWIVNLLLSIVTLGIYSAWAKVRRLQYFDRHTEIAGSSFDYHGDPRRILIGRVIAVVLVSGYQIAARTHSLRALLAILVLLALVMPRLLRDSFRFRLYNTSWRGTRFHFRGGIGDAYRVFLLNGFLSVITLYLLLPFAHQRLKAYQHDNSYFGNTRASFHATIPRFYAIYGLLAAIFAGLIALASITGVGAAIAPAFHAPAHGVPIDYRAFARALGILYVVLIAAGLLTGPVFQALMTNLIWNNTRIGEHRIECHMSPWPLAWISISNFVLVIITLGLYIPFATVRLAKYRLEAVRLLPASDLQEFVDVDAEEVGAVGEEAATAFDFDISL